MEKVFKQIGKIVTIVKVLRMEGKIQKQTYEEIILSLADMKDELNKFAITDPASGKSFSDMDKFVNENINYADSQTMLEELYRRGLNVDNVKEEGYCMTEQDLEKAIKLKEDLDYDRNLLKFALNPSVELNVILCSRERNGDIFIANRVLGDEGIKEIKGKILAIIKDKIHNLESQIEKL